MPRTKGSKNRVTASTDFDAQIEKLQKDKVTLEEGLSKTVAQIEELKTDIKSLRGVYENEFIKNSSYCNYCI